MAEELQQHMRDIGDEVDKIVAQVKDEAVSASSATAAATVTASSDDTPSSSEVVEASKKVFTKRKSLLSKLYPTNVNLNIFLSLFVS